MFPNSLSEEAWALLNEIRRSFKGVQRGSGVTLHETAVIDNYGSPAARKAARRNDTDRNWLEVRDEWIDEVDGVGGLSFLDEESFRYYLPAYMSYWLRKGAEPNHLTFYLQSDRCREFDKLFRVEEKRMIARFLDYVRRQYRDRNAAEALSEYWGQYLEELSQD